MTLNYNLHFLGVPGLLERKPTVQILVARPDRFPSIEALSEIEKKTSILTEILEVYLLS